MPDMNTSRRLSRLDDMIASEPEKSPTANLHEARIRADITAKREAFCLMSIMQIQYTPKQDKSIFFLAQGRLLS
jgi:hypothetical protein